MQQISYMIEFTKNCAAYIPLVSSYALSDCTQILISDIVCGEWVDWVNRGRVELRSAAGAHPEVETQPKQNYKNGNLSDEK